MRKYHLRTRLLAAAGSTLAAAALAVSGIVAAAAAPHTAQARTSGIERFQLMSTDPTGAKTTVIARGVFTAGGVDITTSNTTDTFKFPNGTIRLRHSAGTGPANFNPRTCLGTVNQHGTYTLVGGTGKYAGISGHGTFRLHVLLVAARSHGKCSDTKPPVAFEQIIRASGPVHL
jgi:hypothetical protein